MATSKHKLTRAERHDLRTAQVERRAAYGLTCPTAFITQTSDCGAPVVTPIYCERPDCPDCARRAASENTARYGSVLQDWTQPKMLTLTEASAWNLSDAIKLHNAHRHTLLDTRIGSRARDALRTAHERYITSTLRDGTPRFTEQRIAQLRASAEHFITQCQAEEVLHKQEHKTPFKFRNLFDSGLIALEVTFDSKAGWHVHSHIAVDTSLYIPQTILTALWIVASDGTGHIVDIRAMHDKDGKAWHTELLKYVVKPNSVPIERCNELRDALKGKQTIKPMAGTTPIKPARICQHCNRPLSACQRTELQTIGASRRVGDGAYLVMCDEKPALVTLTRGDDGLLTWNTRHMSDREYTALDTARVECQHIVTRAREELWQLLRMPQTAEVTAQRAALIQDIQRHSNTIAYQVKDTTADELSPVLDPFELDEVMQT